MLGSFAWQTQRSILLSWDVQLEAFSQLKRLFFMIVLPGKTRVLVAWWAGWDLIVLSNPNLQIKIQLYGFMGCPVCKSKETKLTLWKECLSLHWKKSKTLWKHQFCSFHCSGPVKKQARNLQKRLTCRLRSLAWLLCCLPAAQVALLEFILKKFSRAPNHQYGCETSS